MYKILENYTGCFSFERIIRDVISPHTNICVYFL